MLRATARRCLSSTASTRQHRPRKCDRSTNTANATRMVFSIDLPGYGFADRSERACTPRLMTDAVHAFTDQIRERCGPAPFDALALSLSCEFVARAAVERPDRYRSLALVSPTGLSGEREWRGAPGSTRGKPWLHNALRGPAGMWGAVVFRALTRPGVIRYFLRRTWGSEQIDEALWAYDVLTTTVPGAEHAPLHFCRRTCSAQTFIRFTRASIFRSGCHTVCAVTLSTLAERPSSRRARTGNSASSPPELCRTSSCPGTLSSLTTGSWASLRHGRLSSQALM